MDSFAAIRNLQKGGGPVAALVDLIKEWSTWRSKNKITCTYKWISRDENEKADRLSKTLDVQWHLRDDVRRIIESKWGPIHASGDNASSESKASPFVIPRFNEIANTLHNILRRMILIHPIWEGQTWWPSIRKANQSINLPPAAEALQSQTGDMRGLRRSRWRLQASLFEPIPQ